MTDDRRNVELPANYIEAFTKLYADHLLGDFEFGVVSGRGSTLMETRNIRAFLTASFDWNLWNSVLDVGCGDFNWMSTVPLQKVRYLGVDIVRDIIADNKNKWPGVSFKIHDIISDVPEAHDLVICHDLFSHFNFKDTVNAFNNIKKSGSRYIAITGYYPELMPPAKAGFFEENLNIDRATGYWHSSNLRRSPFNLRAPLWMIHENRPGRVFDIWSLDDLPYLSMDRVLNPPVHNPYTIDEFNQYEFFRNMCALPFIREIKLYGSRARGTHRPNSDIDFMVYCDPETSRQQWLQVCEIVRRADITLGIDCMRHSETASSILLDYRDKKMIFRTIYTRKNGT